MCHYSQLTRLRFEPVRHEYDAGKNIRRMFENRVLRRIFVPKREEVTGAQ
jgi:hypothetical protein